MAKQRIVNTKFWDDSYIAGLSPMEKLLFLYLLTNPLTNISGVYELPLKRAAFDVGVDAEAIDPIFQRFESDGKLARIGSWIGIKNFIKHQTLNSKIKAGIAAELRRAPMELVDSLSIDYLKLEVAADSVSIGYPKSETAENSLSHSNLNPNSNSNSNLNLNSNDSSLKELSTAEAQDIHRRARELADRWRVKR